MTLPMRTGRVLILSIRMTLICLTTSVFVRTKFDAWGNDIAPCPPSYDGKHLRELAFHDDDPQEMLLLSTLRSIRSKASLQ